MKCNEHFMSMIHPYELGLLSKDERAEFETHLVECRECFEKVSKFEKTSELIRHNKSVKETALASRSTSKLTMFRSLLIAAVLMIIAVPIIYLNYSGEQAPQSIQIINLVQMRTDSPRLIHLDAGGDVDFRFRIDSSLTDSAIKLTITKRNGDTIYTVSDFVNFDSAGIGSLTQPLSKFEAGRYVLEVSVLSDTDSTIVSKYNFVVE